MKEILQMEDDLSEIVQLVGKDSLNESDKVTLEIAKLIKDDFLQQNGFSPYDRFCPFYKTIWMMRNFVGFYNNAQQVLEQAPSDQKVTWNQIREHTQGVKERLSQMKFELPTKGEEHLVGVYKQLQDDIITTFKGFSEQHFQ